jgi:hypothetical protein
MLLFPEGLKALKKVAKEGGVDLRGASLTLDGGFDSARNRKCIFNAGLIPNIKENPRNRKTTKRGRKRFFNAAIHALPCASSGPLRGRTNLSGCYSALNASSNDTMA